MSMAERYIRATRSSHLKIEPEPGDVDVVIAAGMADSLGTLLLRCRQEWDASRGALELAEDNLDRGLELANIEASSVLDGPTRAELLRRNVEEDALRSRALILLSMTSLAPAKEALKRHAVARATRRSMTLSLFEIARCVGSALDIWLDQRCNACEGRGKNGRYGTPQIICAVCRGSKVRRRVFPSKTNDEHVLGEWLIAEADRLVANAEARMQRLLR